MWPFAVAHGGKLLFLRLPNERSELLLLSLEAEKQSARHQEAAADAVSEISRLHVILEFLHLSLLCFESDDTQSSL